jgi:hypothetical protein
MFQIFWPKQYKYYNPKTHAIFQWPASLHTEKLDLPNERPHTAFIPKAIPLIWQLQTPGAERHLLQTFPTASGDEKAMAVDDQPVQNFAQKLKDDTLIGKNVDFVAFIADVINCTAQTNKKSKKLDLIEGVGERFLVFRN